MAHFAGGNSKARKRAAWLAKKRATVPGWQDRSQEDSIAPGVSSGDRVVSWALSLGSMCHAAQFLQNQGLRRFAGPFDFIFSDARMVAHCLRDDFRTFLDPSQYVRQERESGPPVTCGHAHYSAMAGLPTIFNHHNPSERLDDYEHFERCCTRLRAILKGHRPVPGEDKAGVVPDFNGRKLLLLSSKDFPDVPACRDLVDALREIGTTNFELLVVGFTCDLNGKGREKMPAAATAGDEEDELPPSVRCLFEATWEDAPAVMGAADPCQTHSSVRVLHQRCCAGHSGIEFKCSMDAELFQRVVMHDAPATAGVVSPSTDLVARHFSLEPDPLPQTVSEAQHPWPWRHNSSFDADMRRQCHRKRTQATYPGLGLGDLLTANGARRVVKASLRARVAVLVGVEAFMAAPVLDPDGVTLTSYGQAALHAVNNTGLPSLWVPADDNDSVLFQLAESVASAGQMGTAAPRAVCFVAVDKAQSAPGDKKAAAMSILHKVTSVRIGSDAFRYETRSTDSASLKRGRTKLQYEVFATWAPGTTSAAT
eukprot:gene8660-1548_t